LKASKLGTNLHKDIELFYNKEKIENTSREFNYFLDFHKDNSELKAYRTEWEVFDEDFKLAGSIDCVFELNGEYHIFDWKRTKEIKENNSFQEGKYPLRHLPDANYWHYSLQLNIYKYILENKYGLNIGELNLVVLHPDKDSYELVKAVDLSDEVKLMLEERKKQIKNINSVNE
jgi:ATP-dependent exoDNAse (exonuclease V) beta subunit